MKNTHIFKGQEEASILDVNNNQVVSSSEEIIPSETNEEIIFDILQSFYFLELIYYPKKISL